MSYPTPMDIAEAEDREANTMDTVDECDQLKARINALEVAAWDVHEVVQIALDDPGDADLDAIQDALNVMGELIPANRPTVLVAK
jgi:DUF1365 family protein